MKYGFGIDVGGTTVKLAYFDENGKMLDKWEIPTDTSENGKNIAKDIADSVENYLVTNQIPREDIIGIGMGVPGPVSSDGVVGGRIRETTVCNAVTSSAPATSAS